MSKNLKASDCPRRASWRELRPLLPLLGVVICTCTSFHPPVGHNFSAPQDQPQQFVQIYDQNHNLLQAVNTFCTNLQWTTCSRPEFTDDQAFMGTDQQTYGPPAFIAPAESLNIYLSNQAFQARAVLVGYVFVAPDPAPLPSTYTDLKLNYGNNCLYLRHESGVFKAYVVPQVSTCGTYTPIPEHQLNVDTVVVPNHSGHANIPPVARFHEGNKGPSAGVPFLGIKCGDKWCLVLPQGQGQVVSEWKPPHDGEHPNRRTWAVYGWNDSQHLAVRREGGGLRRSNMRVSVLAVPNLDDITEAQFTADFQHVATVFFRGNPADKYRDTWRFRRGHNEVFLKRISDSDWRAEIRFKRSFLWWEWEEITPARVHRRAHGVRLPGTARFLWTNTDEDLWIECDDGCCRVSGQ